VTVPYCVSQAGIDAAVLGTSRLVVMRGPDPLRFWVISASGDQVTVVGQSSATIAPGADIGIRVITGNVYIRGLKVTGGSSTGVVVENGAELQMDRCIVESNLKGGIQLGTLKFDITNTVIAKNSGGTDSGGVTWGGVRISAMGPAPASTRFLNNTVVQNDPVAFSCATDVAVKGSIVFGNTSGPGAGCTITNCCSGDPLLMSDYHLTSGSPCIGQLAAAMAAPDDIDGQLRANGQMNDCGADEF